MNRINICIATLIFSGISSVVSARMLPDRTDERVVETASSLFDNGDYAAAARYIDEWRGKLEMNNEDPITLERLDYMSVVSLAETDLRKAKLPLMDFLRRYPRSVYSNRIAALIGSACYMLGQYDEANTWFDGCDPESLSNKDCSRMTFHHAVSLIRTGNTSKGYVQLRVLDLISDDYQEDVTFYTAYIDYVEERYDLAEKGFEKTISSNVYSCESKLYCSDIALRTRQYEKAERYAREMVDRDVDESISTEAERVLGEALYFLKRYKEAEEMLTSYVLSEGDVDRQDIYYLGMACYYDEQYDRAAKYLLETTEKPDELAQYAYLYVGLASLETGDKTKARMAFEQASTILGNSQVREQALYNYALIIHETSYSPFAESVTVFERFLNEFPGSRYSDNVNSYLVDVYMSTNSYDAALASIDKIHNPGTSILEAKQQLLFRKSMEMFAGSQYRDIPRYLSNVIDLMQYNKKTGVEAYYWRAETYYRLGDYTKSLADYYRYIALMDGQQTANVGLAKYGIGYIFYQRSDYSKSLDSFKDVIESASLTRISKEVIADACLRAGDCLFYGRSFVEASEYYKTSINVDRQSGDYALYRVGLIDGLLHNYESKIQNMKRLVNEYPISMYVPSALYEEARAYRQQENSSEAVQLFRRIVTDYPSTDLARKSSAEVALIYYQNEQYDEAIKAYKSVVESYPGSDEAISSLRDLKSIYVERGQVNEYADYLSTVSGAVQLKAEERDSLTYSSAERLFAKGDRIGAKTHFVQYLKQYPEGVFAVDAYYYLGEIYQVENDYDKAVESYLHASIFEHSRFCEEAISRAADLAYSVGDFETALDTYIRLNEKTVSVDGQQRSLNGIVLSAGKIKEYDAVLQYADKALAVNTTPDRQTEIMYYKTKALLAENRNDEAREVLDVLSRDVRSSYGAEADFLLSQLYFDEGDREKAEENIMDLIKEGTSHTYWLARSFVLLADIYTAEGKDIEARQYLLSLRQNYTGNDDIANMISSRLKE